MEPGSPKDDGDKEAPGSWRFLLHSDARGEVCNLLGARAAAGAAGPCPLLPLTAGRWVCALGLG